VKIKEHRKKLKALENTISNLMSHLLHEESIFHSFRFTTKKQDYRLDIQRRIKEFELAGTELIVEIEKNQMSLDTEIAGLSEKLSMMFFIRQLGLLTPRRGLQSFSESFDCLLTELPYVIANFFYNCYSVKITSSQVLEIAAMFRGQDLRCLSSIRSKQFFGKCWHFDGYDNALTNPAWTTSPTPYLFPASEVDFRRVELLYEQCPIVGKVLDTVHVIYNPLLDNRFSYQIQLFQRDFLTCNTNPSWQSEPESAARSHIIENLRQFASLFVDADYPDVLVLPMWQRVDTKVCGMIVVAESDKDWLTDTLIFFSQFHTIRLSVPSATLAFRLLHLVVLQIDYLEKESTFPMNQNMPFHLRHLHCLWLGLQLVRPIL
jgi:hypothetical protein